MKNSSQLLKFTETCMRLATQHVPPYSSKFSKHTFTQLKIKLGVTYRDLIDWLAEMPRIRTALGLKRLPHFTTVQKAFQRLGTAIWRVLHRLSASLLHGDGAANARMDERLYHRRSLVETVISVLKRKYGDAVRSRVWWRQFRELVAMCLVYFA